MTTDDVTHLRALLADEHARAEKAGAERDIAHKKLDSLGHTLLKYEETQAMLTNTVKHVERERDQALAACAEMRAVLTEIREWRRAAVGLVPQPKTDAETLGARIDAALLSRPDLGAGWASPEVVGRVATVLRSVPHGGPGGEQCRCAFCLRVAAALADLDALLKKGGG